MSVLYVLIPVAFGLGLIALAGYFWTFRSGQYDDLAGAKNRILNTEDRPLVQRDDHE